MLTRFNSFRDSVNYQYAEFLKGDWGQFSSSKPTPIPKATPTPPVVYDSEKEKIPRVEVEPKKVNPIDPQPRPNPVDPIKETPQPEDVVEEIDFYGLRVKVRMPGSSRLSLRDIYPKSVSEAWSRMASKEMDNTIYDCLLIRDKYNLSDWAYLQLLDEVASQMYSDKNEATLLTAYLFSQSGYQMRLGRDGRDLVMLFGSQHYIYNRPYFILDGTSFYTYGKASSNIEICNVAFTGETPMSLYITKPQKLGGEFSPDRVIKSSRYNKLSVNSSVPMSLIKFYETYPVSSVRSNSLTQWALYAETPLNQSTRDIIYPQLKEAVAGCSNLEAANRLLNWVQTGFKYAYDDEIWGEDRAFFPEETLYYPYCDCEDRAILFSRLIRDIIGLDVALVYYPGHLATAVKFDTTVEGDALVIDGERYVVCDPTYFHAPVGRQMPNLDYSKIETIVLKR